jgi:hypothetical protein
MQDTSANPYKVRLHSARLVNAYMGDLRLAGSRRNTDRGEERTYKVTVNTAFDPLSLLIAGIVVPKALEKVKIVREKVKIEDIKNEAPIQRAKREEELKKHEKETGLKRQNHEGGFLESFGLAAGKLVVDALSTVDALTKKKEDAPKSAPSTKKEDAPKSAPSTKKEDAPKSAPSTKKEDAPKSKRSTKKKDAPKAKK